VPFERGRDQAILTVDLEPGGGALVEIVM